MGSLTGFVLLFVARLMWGGAYGVLNLTNTAYAYGDGRRAGMRVGLNRAVSTIGPVLALGLGGWLVTLVDPHTVFVIYGLVGLAAIPLALIAAAPALRRQRRARTRQRPLDAQPAQSRSSSSIALGADGVFTATLSTLLADIIPVTSAVIGAGLLLAGQRLISGASSRSPAGRSSIGSEAQPRARALRHRDRGGPVAIALGHIYARRGRADLRARRFCDHRRR